MNYTFFNFAKEIILVSSTFQSMAIYLNSPIKL